MKPLAIALGITLIKFRYLGYSGQSLVPVDSINHKSLTCYTLHTYLLKHLLELTRVTSPVTNSFYSSNYSQLPPSFDFSFRHEPHVETTATFKRFLRFVCLVKSSFIGVGLFTRSYENFILNIF